MDASLPPDPAVEAPKLEPAPPAQARPGTVIVLAMCALGAGMLLGFAILFATPEPDSQSPPLRLLAMLALPAAVMGLCAIGFSFRAPEGWRQRLGLVRPQAPWHVLLLALPATWGVWIASIGMTFLGMWLFGTSVEDLGAPEGFKQTPAAWLPLLIAAGGLFPGVGEDLLFRGYLQRGLLRAWAPVLALSVTAFLFALPHQPPARALGILPVAVWLGFLAFRTRSVVPGIACHIFQNVGALTLASFADPEHLPSVSVIVVVLAGIFALGVPSLIACLFLLLRPLGLDSRTPV